MNETIQADQIITHVIDLTKPARKRLEEVIQVEHNVARALFVEARKELREIPEFLINGFGDLYRDYDGPFCAELDAWAKAVGGTFGELAIVNCGYELDHLEHRWSIPELAEKLVFGCTTGLREVSGQGMVHVRTLDWPIATMGSATRLFRYQTKQHEFVSVGFPAYVGVLSGMVPGEYSVTINWAPPSSMPDFHWGPSFLLRKALEECKTYKQAVGRLCRTQLSTSVFYTVCGKQPGEACVIERTSDGHVIRPLTDGVEAQSNHYVSGEFETRNDELKSYASDPLIKTTRDRRLSLQAQLKGITGPVTDLADLLSLLTAAPVNNEETVQRMVFCPAQGELRLDCRVDGPGGQPVWKRSSWRGK